MIYKWTKFTPQLQQKTRCAPEWKLKDSTERVDMKYMEFRLHTCYLLISNIVAASQKSPGVLLCGVQASLGL